ncbi:MAG: HAD family phosphatase [Cryomorphaceae bacterium]
MGIDWNKINAVILDLGGVILNIDYQLTIDAYRNLGFNDFDQQYSKMQQSGLFDRLEKGQIQPDDYVAAMQDHLPHATPTQIIEAWNAMLLDFPQGRVQTVRRIGERWPTFLLSNTNVIHYKSFTETLRKQTELSDIKPLFKRAYLSHEIGMRKPDAEVFQIILAENQLVPDEVLFVDDSPQHIEGARKLGIQAYHLEEPESLEDLFGPFLT